MKKLSTIAIASSLLFVSLNINANSANNQSIASKLDFYEFSVTSSSISGLYGKDFKAKQMDLIGRAREQANMGNLLTAEGLLQRVAKNIYAMPGEKQSPSSLSIKESERMQMVFDAVESILPHAQAIAVEKESSIYELAQVQSNVVRAKNELAEDNSAAAKSIIEDAYLQLKQNVAGLRSGDRLYLTIPAPDTREGWQDAAKRFQDWRFLNEYLQAQMVLNGADVDVFEKAQSGADSLYEEATSIALKGDWEAAVERLDVAYRVLEKSWRDAGIDLGI
jgi:hypothetical protein